MKRWLKTCLALVVGIGRLTGNATEMPPNVIYIMADDLGYGDLGCYGNPLNSTPHIDRLAESGIRLTDFHAAPWCAPSRRALMTGCHASRPWDLEGKRWGRLAAAVTLPELLKSRGYATALLGKWHLELGPGLHPLDQGFDYWYGTKGSNDWDGPSPNYESFRKAPESAWKTPIYVNRENKGPVVPQSLFTKRYTEEALRLIHEHADQPFFIYLAHNMPHVPIFASLDFQGRSRNGVYGDVIEELDGSVGEIVSALEEAGLRERTIVIFTSDNGPWTMFTEFSGVSGLLRGEKSTTWEGGERVPFIVSWPGRIRPKVNHGLMANYDVYATLASLAGVDIPSGQAIDSLNMSGLWIRDEASPRKRHASYFRRPMAYRSGHYKIHLYTRERTRHPETGAREESLLRDPPLLFNLKIDPYERRDLSSLEPDRVQRLQEEFSWVQTAIESWKPFQ